MRKRTNILVRWYQQLTYWQYRKSEKKKQSFRAFRKAVRRAERLAVENNTRYRVYLFDEYRVYSREDLIFLKNRGIISKKDETGILSKNCLYDTLTHANLHPVYRNRKLK